MCASSARSDLPDAAVRAFFGSCFNPDRLTDGICLADLVRSWARHHPAEAVENAAQSIVSLLERDLSEDALRIRVLGVARCGYDPGLHRMSMRQWLTLVRDLLRGRPDYSLPSEAWEPLSAWLRVDVGPLETFRHLLGVYFHEDWMIDDPTFEAVVRRFAAGAGPDQAAALVSDIDQILDLPLGEEHLRILVLGRFGSQYDPRPDLPDGQTMSQWLRAVRGVALSSTISE